MTKPVVKRAGPYNVAVSGKGKSNRVSAKYTMIPGARQKAEVRSAKVPSKAGPAPMKDSTGRAPTGKSARFSKGGGYVADSPSRYKGKPNIKAMGVGAASKGKASGSRTMGKSSGFPGNLEPGPTVYSRTSAPGGGRGMNTKSMSAKDNRVNKIKYGGDSRHQPGSRNKVDERSH